MGQTGLKINKESIHTSQSDTTMSASASKSTNVEGSDTTTDTVTDTVTDTATSVSSSTGKNVHIEWEDTPISTPISNPTPTYTNIVLSKQSGSELLAKTFTKSKPQKQLKPVSLRKFIKNKKSYSFMINENETNEYWRGIVCTALKLPSSYCNSIPSQTLDSRDITKFDILIYVHEVKSSKKDINPFIEGQFKRGVTHTCVLLIGAQGMPHILIDQYKTMFDPIFYYSSIRQYM